MYLSSDSKESPLQPSCYTDEVAHRCELLAVFETTWQFVGLASSVSRNGQYLSFHVGTVPVIVRNFDGELVALRNVCMHRHCQLVSKAAGVSEKLKCPYHGWEYGADGRTCRIPGARNFPGFDRARYQLSRFRLECCGDLLFVQIAEAGPSLREWLGDLYERLEEWTASPGWKLFGKRRLFLAANWKIPVEASLESYHIPEVHPRTFGEDPGENASEHTIRQNSTSFRTSFAMSRPADRVLGFMERFVMRRIGVSMCGVYEHHHIFPGLMISHNDSLTLVQTVRPLTGVTSVSDVWQFGRCPQNRGLVAIPVSFLWNRVIGWLSMKVLKEDMRIFPLVQSGETAAPERSILGRCEERLYALQRFVADRTGQTSSLENKENVAECRPQCSAGAADADIVEGKS
jgi:choline monooxygenase